MRRGTAVNKPIYGTAAKDSELRGSSNSNDSNIWIGPFFERFGVLNGIVSRRYPSRAFSTWSSMKDTLFQQNTRSDRPKFETLMAIIMKKKKRRRSVSEVQ